MNFSFASLSLFFLQLVAHVALVYGIFYFTVTEWCSVLFVYFLTGCIGVSITLHRYMSHAAFRMPRYMEIIGVMCSTYGIIGSSLAWVNNHRAHHRYADREGDPHSPVVHGFLKVQWFSMFISATKFKYMRKFIADSYHVFMHRYYFVIHSVLILLFLTIADWHTMAVWYLAPAAVLWNAGSCINTLGHSPLGYLNHNVRDHSRNNLFLGYFVWGEGWHNNHHYLPARETFQDRWWELDISAMMIKLISLLPGKK